MIFYCTHTTLFGNTQQKERERELYLLSFICSLSRSLRAILSRFGVTCMSALMS